MRWEERRNWCLATCLARFVNLIGSWSSWIHMCSKKRRRKRRLEKRGTFLKSTWSLEWLDGKQAEVEYQLRVSNTKKCLNDMKRDFFFFLFSSLLLRFSLKNIQYFIHFTMLLLLLLMLMLVMIVDKCTNQQNLTDCILCRTIQKFFWNSCWPNDDIDYMMTIRTSRFVLKMNYHFLFLSHKKLQ